MKRSQKKVSENSQHWYQDKYQHVLTQRNLLMLVALVALITALVAVVIVMQLTPLKSVEPYLLQIDEKTGITQRVDPVSRRDYAASVAVDRYFTSTYLRMRESYNFSTLLYNQNVVRLMSTPDVFYPYRQQLDPGVPGSLTATLGAQGQRVMKIKSMSYISAPAPERGQVQMPPKIMQIRMTTVDTIPNRGEVSQDWVVTLTFEYANLNLNEADQLINPIGYTVTSYQIQREIN